VHISIDAARTWTRDMLAALPDDGLRYELCDGNLVVTPLRQRHQWWADRLAQQLRSAVPSGWRVVVEMPLPLGDTDLRVPDVMVHRWPLSAPADDVDPLRAVDVGLIVEIVSSRTAKTDRFLEPGEYAGAGIPAYWRLETEPQRVLHPNLLRDGGYVAQPSVVERGEGASPWAPLPVDLAGLDD
jgi:Uma2 family endonuclease